MPENNPIKHDDPKVDVDTSGPEVEVNLPEEKAEEVVDTTEAPKQETVETKQVYEYHKMKANKRSLSCTYSRSYVFYVVRMGLGGGRRRRLGTGRR